VKTHVLGAGEAALAIARVSLRRVLRGKAIWVVLGLCLLPELFGMLALREHDIHHWRDAFGMSSLLLALLPPILIANTIGEEIEERTMAYLWSRPLPRTSILAGKLLALVPPLAVVMCAAMALPFFTALGGEGTDHMPMFTAAMFAVVAGTVTASCVTAGLATLAPRFGIVLGIGYLVVIDGVFAAVDSGISRLSVAYNTQMLAGTDGTPDYPALGWLIGIAAVWLGVAVWRIRRIE
jgi:ABC-type transport system involved in multi-copper enzyme maturation permease subunit